MKYTDELLERQRIYNARHAQTAKGRRSQKRRSSRYYARHRELINQRRRENQEDPEYALKRAARDAVYQALKRGTLQKQACRCGSLKVQAHHSDYSKPLDVVWLCKPCHTAEHVNA